MVKLFLNVKEFKTIFPRGGEGREAGMGIREEGTLISNVLKMGVGSFYNYGS